MVPVITRAKHYEYFMLENCTQTTHVYWSKNPLELLYIYIWQNNLRLNRVICFKFWNIFKISMYVSSIGTSLFEVLPLCSEKSHYFKNCYIFSIHLLIPVYGQFVTIKTSQDEFSFGKTLFQPETTHFTHKDDFSWQGTDPQMSPICSEWYSQSDRRKILEPPRSVLDN